MLIIASLNLPYTATFEADEQQAVLEEQRNAMQSAQSLVHKDQEPQEPEPEVPFDFAEESNEAEIQSAMHKGSQSTSKTASAAPSQNTSRIASRAASKPSSRAGSPPRKPINFQLGAESPEAPRDSSQDASQNDKSSSTATTSNAATTTGTTSGISHAHATANLTPHTAPAASTSSSAASRATSPPPPGTASNKSSHPNEILRKSTRLEYTLKNTGFPAYTLANSGSPGDYDTQLECEMFARAVQQGRKLNTVRKNSSASLMMMAGMNTPPQTFKIIPSSACNRGMFNALDSAVDNGKLGPYKSVGLMTISSDSLTEIGQRDISAELEKHNCYNVVATDAERKGHYANYCKEFLWPTFHCMTPDIPRSKAYEDRSWGSYVSVNQKVADKVVEVYEEGDIVWVHDYHLMLVPLMVREKLPNAAIGFFLHVAFPSSEVFRSLAYRAELLSGVLASNLIGFHIPEYVQHFKMSLARILAVDISGKGVVETADHDAFITSLPLAIDTERLEHILAKDDPTSAVQQHRKAIRARWPHQFLIAARDKADPIRGLQQKLRAFDKFLSENPQWANRVVLVQICSSGYSGSGIETIADKINSNYGDIASGIQPVVLLKQDVKYEQYLALLIEANGFCVTCLRDGMNLTCHEYAVANDPARMGPLILSEFTGSASVLGQSATLVNPWDQDQLVQAFKSCVEMPRWERQQKSDALKYAVGQYTASDWAHSLYDQIMQAWQDEKSRECSVPDLKVLQDQYHSVRGNEKRLFLLEAERPITVEASKRLHEEAGAKLKESYDHLGEKKDFDTRGGAYYTSRLPTALRDLCSDPRNIVYVISPENPDYMERMFRSLPGIGLISEFGKYIRMQGEDRWIEIEQENDTTWKDRLRPFIEQFKNRGIIRTVSIHDSSVIIEFNLNEENVSEGRDHSGIGEYLSLVNDQYAGQGGIRTKLEGNILTLYRTSLGKLRQQAFQHIVNSVPGDLGLTLMANQPYSSDSEDIVYSWAESLKTLEISRDVITLSVGKHPSLAMWMVEGTNSLLNLLHSMRTRETVMGLRRISRPA